MIKNYKKLAAILISITLLTGCGFTPYSIKSLPPQLRRVYLQAEHPYGPLEVGFKRKLKKSGVVLLQEPEAAAPIMYLTSSYAYNSNISASSIQARIYNLSYTAKIMISDFNHKELLPTQTVSVVRDVTLQSNEVFETTPQVDIVKQEMLQELSIKILNTLSSRKVFQSLQSTAT